ncbi:MBL fold metallo-hydrolase [Actinosynnema sp. NPDC050801]|uniref:MBL fold metallo-hydrolase n=1 Tax=unclassified Actinosynnema TaxID=2637065 RepID=UPI0033D410F4
MTTDIHMTTLGHWSNSSAGPTTSFHLAVDDAVVMLDVGIDPIGRLQANGLSPTDVTHVYVSHLHSDHVGGFANFAFTRSLLNREGDVPLLKLTVVGHPTILAGLKELLHLQYPERTFDLAWVECTDQPVALGGQLRMRLVETDHPVPCYGVVVETGRARIGFTADTGPVPSHERDFADCDILIGEAFGLTTDVGESIHRRGHMTAEDLGALVAATRPKFVVPFHFGQEYADAGRRAELLNACGAAEVTTIDPVDAKPITLGD